jgi:hypothetical protein
MDFAARATIVADLAAAFGQAADVSPDPAQPLHVLLPTLSLPSLWQPNPTRAIVRFTQWSDCRPEFFIDAGVRTAAGQPPRSSSAAYVIGEHWLQFSFAFPWPPAAPISSVRAVQMWLTRFREGT